MGSGRARWWAAALGASSLAVLTGCAAVPVSGVAQPMPGTSGQPQQFVEPLPPPGPQVGESWQDVVTGFLHASASFAEDPAAVRAYLAPTVKWHPAGTVTIVSPNPTVGLTTRVPPAVSGQSGVQQVLVTGQRIATIDRSGQYSYQPGATATFTFTLARYGGKLLITQLPANTSLLLTQSDFEEVFQPHNLYFYSGSAYPSGGALVPDPVYVPVQGPNSALSATVAGSLVNALINDRRSWLGGPTTTEFPAGTTLLRPVTISNQTALVDLGGTAATAGPGRQQLMYAQLQATLTSSAYSPAVATGVELAVDGKIQSPKSAGVVVPVAGSAVCGPRGASTLYFASNGPSKGLVQQLQHRSGSPAPGLAQLASPGGITALAVSPAPDCGSHARPAQAAVAVPQGSGCAVHAVQSDPTAYPKYTITTAGGPCTSLNWDNNGSLWAVTGSGIYVLQAGSSEPLQVSPPAQLPAGSRVLSLRMAPDAVRAALLVQTGWRTQLYVAAVKFGSKGVSFGPAVPVGTDLAVTKRSATRTRFPQGVAAVTWYNAYFLLAVEGSQVYQVPLTGGPLANGQSTALATGALPPDVRSLTAAGPELAVGTASGSVYTSITPYFSWIPVQGKASQPAFSG